MKYKIGIPGWKTGENSFGVTAPYMQFIEFFNAEVIMLTPKSSIQEDLDMVLVPGGPDVNPLNYGDAPEYYTGKPCPFREFFDKVHLPKYIDLKIPIYGICRGMQSISVMFGAKMIQHVDHVTSKNYDRGELVHTVDILAHLHQTLRRNLGVTNFKQNFQSNSIHHQVVDRDSLKASELELIGTSRCKHEPAYVELVAHPKLPIVLQQAHPEEMYDWFSIATINYLLENKKSILL